MEAVPTEKSSKSGIKRKVDQKPLKCGIKRKAESSENHKKHLTKVIKDLSQSKYRKIRIRPGIVTIGENEQLFHFRQYHPANNQNSRKAFGNVIVFDKRGINDLKDILQKMEGDAQNIQLRER